MAGGEGVKTVSEGGATHLIGVVGPLAIHHKLVLEAALRGKTDVPLVHPRWPVGEGSERGGVAGGGAYMHERGMGSQLEKEPATLTDLPSTHSRVTGTCIAMATRTSRNHDNSPLGWGCLDRLQGDAGVTCGGE